MAAADTCRERGWGVGTLIVWRFTTGRFCWIEACYRITAIGELHILARVMGDRSNGSPEWEAATNVIEREVRCCEESHAIYRLPWEKSDGKGAA